VGTSAVASSRRARPGAAAGAGHAHPRGSGAARRARRLLPLFLAATPAPAAAQQPRFRHLGIDDGLPSSLVTGITEDRRGFLWVGTSHGVTRYDGHHFRTYDHQPSDPTSLPTDQVDQVYVDRHDVVWVVTTRALSRYDETSDRFVTRVSAPAGKHAVTGVVEDARGTMWVGTSAGLYRLDHAASRATRVPLTGASTSDHVMSLYADHAGRLWIGTTHALYRIDPTGAAAPQRVGTTDAQRMPDAVVSAITEDVVGALWVGTTGGGLVRVDEGTGAIRRYRNVTADTGSLAHDRVRALAADRHGGVWVGTENGGLDHYDPLTGRFTHHRFDANNPSSIGSNSVWSVHVDASGALWVGTFSGGLDVSPMTAPAIEHFRAVPGDTTSLSYNAVPKFAESRDGSVWVATDGGGLDRFDPSTGKFARVTPQNSNLNSGAVVGVLEDRRGDVWVGTWGGGLSRFDARRRRFSAYTTQTTNLPNDHVLDVYEDRAGRLWLGMDSSTVAVFDRATGRVTERYRVADPSGDPALPVKLVRQLADGTMALGLQAGALTLLDPRTGTQTQFDATDVRTLYEETPGVLWIGSSNGLDRVELKTGRRAHFGEAEGLPSRFVDGVLPDGTGRLWVSTDHGLARLDPRTGAVRVFAPGDGVQGGEFLRGAALRARDGTLYFGGNRGFNVVHPDRVVDDTRVPPVVITGLQLFNRAVPVNVPGSPLRRTIDRTDTLVLDHAQNVVTFEFAALDYAAPEKNHYAYRLDGFDRAWQDVGGQYTASYTNLAPGRYTLRVKASNADGVWNERGATLALVITPPVWQTWWFRALALAAALGAALALLRFQQRRRLEVALGRQALRDALTGLANRALFRDRVEHALTRLARPGALVAGAPQRVAVLFLDLDGFKAVNDRLGHHAGDRLLQGVAARLLNATRGCDTVARLGGDEFAVLLENARGAADAVTVAERIVHMLSTPIPLDDAAGGARSARVSASVGIAFAEPAVSVDTLLRQADAAMYQVKADGKGRYAVVHPPLVAAADERLALDAELAGALERGELALAYQPIVSLDSGDVVEVEALLRWHHPTRGVVPPSRFIPLAEASGLIVPLGRWVLEEACRAAASLPNDPGDAPLGVTVNVSGRQLDDPALPEHVAAALAASGLPAHRLTLEITESALTRDTRAALASLGALKASGVRLAIDDFGTGYSSLRYLQQFPIDVLKIDKSFVDGVERGGHDAAFARTIVSLADTLALRTVAEGIELPEQRDRLRDMGCTLGQGYLFAHPLDRDELEALLAQSGAARAPAAATR